MGFLHTGVVQEALNLESGTETLQSPLPALLFDPHVLLTSGSSKIAGNGQIQWAQLDLKRCDFNWKETKED